MVCLENVKKFTKKLFRCKFVPILAGFLVVPLLFVSVFAVTTDYGINFLNNPYGRFTALAFGVDPVQRYSGDVYEFEYQPTLEETADFAFTQIIEDFDFNYYDASQYGVNLLLVRSPLAINRLREGESFEFYFDLENSDSQIDFQPTAVTVQIHGAINGVDKTWVYSPINEEYHIEGIVSGARNYYAPDTEYVHMWDSASFEISLGVPRPDDANYPPDTDYLVYSIDFIEIALGRVEYTNSNLGETFPTYQYTNTADININNVSGKFRGYDETTDTLINALNANNDKILQYLQVKGLLDPDQTELDNVLDADADIDDLAKDAIDDGNKLVDQGVSRLASSFWSYPFLFMTSVFNKFFYANGSSSGVFAVIASVLVPIGLFGTFVGLVSSFVNSNRKSRKKSSKKSTRKKGG